MALFKSMAPFFVLALAAIYRVNAVDDLSNICQRLDETRPLSDLALYEDAEKVYSFASGQLNKLGGFGRLIDRSYLSSGWDKALHRKGCDGYALKYIATIARCDPDRFESMGSLSKATRAYARECLTPAHIKARIEAETGDGGCLSSFKGPNANELLDHSFVEDYYHTNPREKWMDLEAIKSEKAISALVNSIRRKLTARNFDVKEAEVASGSEATRDFLSKHVYSPCSGYVRVADRVMNRIFDAAHFIEGGLPAFLSILDHETQEAVFRYTLCKDFVSENRQERFSWDMWMRLVKEAEPRAS